MIAASVLGLPAILLLLTVLPCIRMGHEPGVAKYRRAQLAGVLLILLGKTAFYIAPQFRVNLMNLRSCCCFMEFKRHGKGSQVYPPGENPHSVPLYVSRVVDGEG